MRQVIRLDLSPFEIATIRLELTQPSPPTGKPP